MEYNYKMRERIEREREREGLIKMPAGGHSVKNTDLRGERPDSVQNSQNGIRAEKYN